MTKPIAEATVVGDFREGTKFADHDRAYTFGMKDGKPSSRLRSAIARRKPSAVDYTLGAKRYQGYLSTLPDGRIYVLPMFWHIGDQALGRLEGDHVDTGRRARIPSDLEFQLFQLPRHQPRPGLRRREKKYKSTWTEMGIGCEACHGPDASMWR